MCPPMRAHWRHLANTIELVLPSAHPTPKPKRQIDRFTIFAQITEECRRADWHHLANTIELVHPSAHSSPQRKNGKSIGSAVFAHLTAGGAYTLQWASLSTRIAPSIDILTSIEHIIPWAHASLQSKRYLDRFSRFVQMTAECPYTVVCPFLPQNCPFPWGDLDLHVSHGSLDQPESSTKRQLIASAVFCRPH